MTIPKLIHQFWMSESGEGNEALPDDMLTIVQTWEQFHPEYTRRTWTLEDLAPLLSNFHGIDVLSAVNACRFAAMRSDIIRLALVYEYGGVWSDLKNEVLAPFLDEFVVTGVPFIAEHPPTPTRPEPTDYLYNALFGAPAKSPMIFEFLVEACKSVEARSQGSVFGITGGAMLMKIVKRAENRGEPYQFETLRYEVTWGKRVKRRAASYNDGGMHWSKRQKTEGLYLD